MLRPVSTLNVPFSNLKKIVDEGLERFDDSVSLYDKFGLTVQEQHTDLSNKVLVAEVFQTITDNYGPIGQPSEITIGAYELSSLLQLQNFGYFTEEYLEAETSLTEDEEDLVKHTVEGFVVYNDELLEDEDTDSSQPPEQGFGQAPETVDDGSTES